MKGQRSEVVVLLCFDWVDHEGVAFLCVVEERDLLDLVDHFLVHVTTNKIKVNLLKLKIP